LEALAILEAATLECKKREVDTPELRAALDFLESHIQPAWLIGIAFALKHGLKFAPVRDYGSGGDFRH
jgi:hypothetical protein